ncbi:circadian clock protein PASD1 isoform X1 [Prionailurus iriomotensis]
MDASEREEGERRLVIWIDHPVSINNIHQFLHFLFLGKVNLETSRDISNWIPSFQSYEDFKCKTLQSLDGFMIILSLDGVIIYVGGSITCLLGHLPDEIVGKKLLSLLPDHEKSEVHQKIALKLPSSSSVGKHTDFCCHIKRGNDKHISNEPLVLFSSFFPSPSFAESCGTYLPLEDRFYLVGSICILRTQILRDLFTVEKAGEDIQLINDSDEEHLSTECRSVQGQIRISRMESLCAEPAAPASDVSTGCMCRTSGEMALLVVVVPFSHSHISILPTPLRGDQVDLITVKQYGLQESVHESGIESATCYDSSISSMESIPESSATSSLQSFEFEPDVEQVDDMDEVQQVDEVEKMGQIDEMEEVEQVDKEEEVERAEEVEEEDQLDQVEQEALSSFSVAGGISDEAPVTSTITVWTALTLEDIVKLLEPLPSIALYINKRELGLMRKFREQLEEKTRMLQAEIRSLQDALEMMKEQLRRIEDSGFQIRGQFHMQPTTSHHLHCPEPQSLEPVPKKPRTEQMEGPFSDFKDTSLSCGSSSHYFKFPEDLEEPFDASNQLMAGQHPPDNCQDENLGGLKDDSQREVHGTVAVAKIPAFPS